MSLDLDERGLLTACTRDAHRAWFGTLRPAANPARLARVHAWLAQADAWLPAAQIEAVLAPLRAWIDRQPPAEFAALLAANDGDLEMFFDVLHAVRPPTGRTALATAAFQEVVSDLYDGFLSAEDRRGVVSLARVVLPPLVRWGDPDIGLYTWTSEALEELGVRGAVVCMSPSYTRGGLAGWAALSHETCGHDILAAYSGLQPELRRVVARALEAASIGDRLIEHWMFGFEEAAADVMGVLNLGPAAALADVAFYRGCHAAGGTEARMGTVEDPTDEHPVDLLRVMVEASVVRGLRFADAEVWAATIEREVRRDARGEDPVIGGRKVPLADARSSAAVYARAIVGTRLDSLSGVSLGEIQNWHDTDQVIADKLRKQLLDGRARPVRVPQRAYAAHVLAGALMANFELGVANRRTAERVETRVFNRMVATLAQLHDKNPAWQPRAAYRHRGDAATRHFLRRKR